MVLGSIVYSIVFITVITFGAKQCGSPVHQIKSMEPSFGGCDGFYGIGKGLADGFQPEPDSKTYDDLAGMIFGKLNPGDVIKSMFLGQIMTILFWSIGIICVLVALVLGIVVCIWSCCSTCVPKDTKVRSEVTGYLFAFSLASIFIFALTGLVFFNFAETDLIDSVDNTLTYANQISGDLNTVIGGGTQQITCEVKSTTTKTFADMEKLIRNYATIVVDGTKKRVGLTEVNDFNDQEFEEANTATSTAAQNLQNFWNTPQIPPLVASICDINSKTLKNQLNSVIATVQGLTTAAKTIRNTKELKDINAQIKTIKEKIQDQSAKATSSMKNTQAKIDQSMSSITDMLTKLQKDIDAIMTSLKTMHKNFVDSGSWTSMTLGLRIGVIIPAITGLVFCIIAFVAVALSLKKQDGFAQKLSGTVLSGVSSLVTASITLMVIAIITFVLGWGVSAVCVPVFETPGYQLFHRIKQEVAPVGNGTPVVVNVGKILEQCSSDTMTLYKAIDGKTIISKESIIDQLKLDSYRQQANGEIMKQPNLTFPVNKNYEDYITKLNGYTSEAKGANLEDCNDASLNNLYTAYITALEKSNELAKKFQKNLNALSENSPKTTAIATELNDNYFKKGDASINEAITKLMTDMEQKVFICRPLVEIFKNGGLLMCERFGRPIQGLWAGVGLTALFCFFLCILLLFTFRWLKTNSKETVGSAKGSFKNGLEANDADFKKGDKKKNGKKPSNKSGSSEE
ncbi:hypothetical protein GCK72_011252 [Caenorhabditis remanei]|uniref:Uncharacterized protein n=1 Tax=Caenorhabditis remanei TaxID=31234 RepID=A0A6A5H721_CAERE|nr:hypothetical protein GCK72_011252 [Caenorhabditis remanei]KAF1762987.1 hypothetical protein GCK72_011252 [Caenorhabditis remanei]